jgi:hypothetical protein
MKIDQKAGAARILGAQRFDGHHTAQSHILRLINFRQAAFPNLFYQLVAIVENYGELEFHCLLP